MNARPSRRTTTRSLALRTAFAAAAGLMLAAGQAIAEVKAFRVAKVVTMDADDRVVNNATVIVRDGKIETVGRTREVEIPEGATVIDMPRAWLVPGIVELHNHTAGSLSDLNDMVYLANPGLRTLETVVPGTFEWERAQAAGITAALLIPGSGTNISGLGTVVKFTDSLAQEDAVVRSPGSLKVAQAGNPERYWWRVDRMMMNFNTRRTLRIAQEYHEAWTAYEAGERDERPEFNPLYEEYRGLFAREYPASVHTQIYQVILSTVEMLGREFGLKVVLDHSTFDSWKVAPLVLEVGEENIITIVGPRSHFFDLTQRKMMGIVQRWHQAGITKLGINTDAPVIPQEELTNQAAIAVWLGFDPYLALAGLTRVGAEAVMMEDQIGTIEPGKDADFAIWTGDPLDPRHRTLMTVVDGRIVYDSERDGVRH